MAVRYPLVVDTTDNNKIKELPTGDSLNLNGNNIVNVVNVTASGTLTVQNLAVESTTFTVNGTSLNTVAFTGSYTDLSNTPTLFNGAYASLTGKPDIPQNIQDLANVGTTTPGDGEILVYNSTLGRYEPGTINASFNTQFQTQDIDNLNNVVFTGDKTDDVLKFVSGVWRNERVDFGELTGTLDVVQQGDTLTGSLVGDVKGSIFGDDSTLLVDSVNNVLTGSLVGDVTGSVFADNSTLLVDGVNGKIVGDYENGTSTIGSTRVESYDIKAFQDTNTNDLYVANRIWGGETGTIKNVSIGSTAPTDSTGADGDRAGMIAFDSTSIYYCIANWASPGTANIWVKQDWGTTGAWS